MELDSVLVTPLLDPSGTLELMLRLLPRARSGNHLEANRFVVEILKALTPRLADSQSNLKPLAATALAEVASSVPLDSATKVRIESCNHCPVSHGPHREWSGRHNRIVLPPLSPECTGL